MYVHARRNAVNDMLRDTCHFSLAYYTVGQLFCVHREIPDVQHRDMKFAEKRKMRVTFPPTRDSRSVRHGRNRHCNLPQR